MDVLIDTLPHGVTIKQVRGLARRHGNFKWSYTFGATPNVTHLFTFDRTASAAAFVQSNPCVNGKPVIVSLFNDPPAPQIVLWYPNHDSNHDSNHDCLNMDCLHLIFSYLSYTELVTVSITCRMWYNVAIYFIHNLTQLDIPWKPLGLITDEGVVKILKRMDLSSVDISGTMQVGGGNRLGRVMKGIVDHCPNLTKLQARHVDFKKRPVHSFFSQMNNLTHLDLSHGDLREIMLNTILTNCESLTHLNVSHTLITGSSFRNHKTKITSLNIGDCELIPFSLGMLMIMVNRFCPCVEKLDISGSTSTMVDPYLKDIFVVQTVVSPDDVIMGSLKKLVMCRRDDTRWNGPDLDTEVEGRPGVIVRLLGVKARLPVLETLDISNCWVHFMFLHRLIQFVPNLRSLDMSAILVTDFLEQSPTQIKVLFSSLKGLEVLRFNRVVNHSNKKKRVLIGDTEGICMHIIRCISSTLIHLRVLEISHFIDLENVDVLELLSYLKKLQELNI